MEDIIKIRNLNYSYENNKIFDRINFNIKNKKITSFIGLNNSGKTTLIKLLSEIMPLENKIIYNNDLINNSNLDNYLKDISTFFLSNNKFYYTSSVEDEILFYLGKCGYTKTKIKTKLKYITQLLSLKSILKKNPYTISKEEEFYFLLALAIVKEPKLVLIDDIDNDLTYIELKKVFKLLKSLTELGLTFIITALNLSSIEESDYIYILNNKKILIEGSINEICLHEKELVNESFILPYMYDLSSKLQIYDLIKNPVNNIDEMVDELWK